MSNRPVVSADWLHENLKDKKLQIVDASWHLPPEHRDAQQEYLDEHIPGAVFFDIDVISEPGDLPHMVPSVESFIESVSALGLSPDKTIVVYDSKGLFSAARVWWTLKVFGFEDVRILDGGLPAWKSEGYQLESGSVAVSVSLITANFASDVVVDASQVLAASNGLTAHIVDARSQGRFDGVDPEPRAGLRSGHIPHSVCLPYTMLLSEGRLKSNAELEQLFVDHGVTTDKPVLTTCGSGVTAAILTLGLHCIGRDDVALYDGSWTEWGGRDDLPVARVAGDEI